MTLNSYLPNACKRYAIAGLAIGLITPLAAFAGDFFVGARAAHSDFASLTSPLGMTAIAVLMAVTGLIAGLGCRHNRFVRQIESERAGAEKLRQAAYHDSLTGLRNRYALTEDVDRITRSNSGGPAASTLLLFDLDRFKFINDSMGHAAGDAVLKALAERLQVFCSADRQVYRLGGDEFVILWEGVPTQQEVIQLCNNLATSVFRPVSYGPSAIDTAGSIGIAVSNSGRLVLSDLLKRADLALYRAKSNPGTRFCFFTEGMDGDYRLRRELEAAMRDGVATGAFGIDYLPVVNAATLSPSGFKARLRWNHPDHGNVAPDVFMPMAEGSGLIVLIGKWMLRQALSDASSWHEPAEITLPVSPLQLQDPGFAPRVLMALADAGVVVKRLVLDIRSNSTLGECAMVLTNLEALRAAGVQIAVSELAASVASLSMARPYPVDRIRLDLGRIKSIAGEKKTPQMLNLFLQLAATMGTPVTLTGVDTEDDLQAVCTAEPAELQGSFAGTPLSAEQAQRFFMSMNGLIGADFEQQGFLRACSA